MNDRDYELIKKEIMALTGIELGFYKTPQMQRRLKTYLLRSGQVSWVEFFKVVRNNPAELRKLKDYLTINVSSFFRDPEKYKYLKEKILPELLNPPNPDAASGRSIGGRKTLRIWSAGCSLGQEPYSLAMTLAELTGTYTKHYILASDLDQSALEKAQAGGPYTADDVSNVPPDMLKQYFTEDGKGFYAKLALRQKVTFKQHNLLADPFETNFDLVICRNVVIYFTAEVKDQLYKRFRDSLRHGGMLFVGGTEIVSQATSIGLHTAGISFYRRNGVGES